MNFNTNSIIYKKQIKKFKNEVDTKRNHRLKSS